MGYVFQFREIAHKRVQYYYHYIFIFTVQCHCTQCKMVDSGMHLHRYIKSKSLEKLLFDFVYYIYFYVDGVLNPFCIVYDGTETVKVKKDGCTADFRWSLVRVVFHQVFCHRF